MKYKLIQPKKVIAALLALLIGLMSAVALADAQPATITANIVEMMVPLLMSFSVLMA